jgi:type I restriction enzyme S subunit
MTNGWQEVLLGDVLTERRETPSPESLENGEVSIVSKIGFNEGKIELRTDGKTKTGMILAHPGDLVISGINATKGAIAIYPETAQKPIAATIHYGAYIPNKERVDIQYLWWFLRSVTFRDIVQHHIPGGIKTELKAKRLLSVPVTLPSLKEQQRILARIESLRVQVSDAKRLRKEASIEAKALWLSTLHKLFEQYSDSLGVLNDYSAFITDGTHVTPTYVDNGIPFVTVRNIANRKMSFSNIKYISREQHEIYCKRVKPEYGDVLYTKDGATLGIPCFVDTDREFSFFVSVAIIKPKPDLLDGKFLAYFLDSPQVFEQVTRTKTGAVLPHIVIRAIKAIKLPVPPLDEQRRIVVYLDGLQAKVNALRELQSASGEELSTLMPSILDKAFKGEL